jgi:hypothetical protein
MDTPPDTPSAASSRRWFYGAAMLLLLVGVTAAFFQIVREGAVAATGAKRIAAGVQETDEHRNNLQQIIQDAERWQILSLAAVSLAIASWGIAVWRHETLRGAWVIIVSLLALYVVLELLIV